MSRRKSNLITQADRQVMLSVDKNSYQDIKTASNEKRRKAQEKARNLVIDTFHKKVRPLMEVGRAYSLNEMWNLYKSVNPFTTEGFQYLLLNKSELLNVEHICTMPLHVMVDEVPESAVSDYSKEIAALRELGREFMNTTGMRVELPDEVDERWLRALFTAAVKLERSGNCVPVKEWQIGAEEYSYGRAPQPSDFRTMERMGIKFRRLKTVSAFWIDHQF